jgi:hypothetical protein
MRRASPLAVAVLALAIAAGCGGLGGGSMSAEEVEESVETMPDIVSAHCSPGRNGWDYECRQQLVDGSVIMTAYNVDGEQLRAASGAYDVGDEVGASPDPDDALDLDSFRSAAIAACKGRRRALNSLSRGTPKRPLVDTLARAVQIQERELVLLRRLAPPLDVGEAFSDLINAKTMLLSAATSAHRAVAAGDVSSAESALERVSSASDRTSLAAHALRLPVCGDGA